MEWFPDRSVLNKENLAWGKLTVNTQSMCLGSLKWIMMHEECITKFCVFHPLTATTTTKKAAEVVLQLLDMSLTFEDTFILQDHDGT